MFIAYKTDVVWLGIIMSNFKRRDVERKGVKKQQGIEDKLIEENLDDLVAPTGELEELPEED